MTDTTQQQDAGLADQTKTTDTTQDQGQNDGGKAADKGGAADKGTTKGPQLKAEEDAPWYAGLPDDLKGEKTILRHANVEDAVRALVGAEKRLGVPADQLVKLPSKPEETAELYRKLGAPDTAEGYQIGLPKDASDADKAAAKSFAEHMHKAGPFPPDFVKAALEWNNQQAEAASAELAQADANRKADGVALLKRELGATYDPDMKAVGKLLNDLGGEELQAELDASGMGDNPRLMLVLQKIVNERAEPGELIGNKDGSGASGAITPGQAKAARENLENDPVRGTALRDSSHAMHKSVVEERKRLLRIENSMNPDDG